MLKNFVILFLWVVAIEATGEFIILNSHNSLSFKGNDPIQSHDIGDVVYASLGNEISRNCSWTGLHISDPFNLTKNIIFISLNGVDHINLPGSAKAYPLHGNTVEQSLNGVVAQLEAKNEGVCTISFKDLEEGKLSFSNVVGEVEVPPVANTQYLDGNLHTADKQYLESCAYLNAIATNIDKLKKQCNLIYISLFIDAVAKAHGERSDAVIEALEILSTAVKHLNTTAHKSSNNDTLVLVAVNKADGYSRSKRDVAPDDAKTRYNLAEYYNQDYPVIFNIILWFMVVFGFSLLAICYAIGSMDPGRDSIIYRMTSTRMKKDN